MAFSDLNMVERMKYYWSLIETRTEDSGDIHCEAIGKYDQYVRELPMISAIENGDNRRVQALLISEAVVNGKLYTGQTPLFYAVSNNQTEICETLLRAGADVNEPRNSDQRTPLIMAVYNDNWEIVRLLMANGADVDRSEKDGNTPLLKACKEGYFETAAELLKKADANKPDRDGTTPLMWASLYGYRNLVSLLLQQKADVNLSDEEGNTALGFSSEYDNVDVVQLLLNNGAFINSANGEGDTPLHLASEKGCDEVVTLLLENDADVNMVNGEGETPMLKAALAGDDDIVNLIFNSGAKTEPKDKMKPGMLDSNLNDQSKSTKSVGNVKPGEENLTFELKSESAMPVDDNAMQPKEIKLKEKEETTLYVNITQEKTELKCENIYQKEIEREVDKSKSEMKLEEKNFQTDSKLGAKFEQEEENFKAKATPEEVTTMMSNKPEGALHVDVHLEQARMLREEIRTLQDQLEISDDVEEKKELSQKLNEMHERSEILSQETDKIFYEGLKKYRTAYRHLIIEFNT